MAILEEFVEISVNGTTRKYYTEKGYEAGIGTRRMKVRPEDLKRKSEVLVTPVCDECGKIEKQRKYKFVFRDTFYGTYLCSKCRYDINVTLDRGPLESRGEYTVRSWLEDAGVNFRTQVRRKGVVGLNGRPLLFDFAILNSEDEPIAFIEYDGEQHYRPVLFAGNDPEKAEDKFVYQQEHDKRKDRYCKFLGVPMIRITYETPMSEVGAELDKRMEEVLSHAC